MNYVRPSYLMMSHVMRYRRQMGCHRSVASKKIVINMKHHFREPKPKWGKQNSNGNRVLRVIGRDAGLCLSNRVVKIDNGVSLKIRLVTSTEKCDRHLKLFHGLASS